MKSAEHRPVLVHEARNVEGAPQGRVVVVGNFDGVHRGHQVVIERAGAARESAEGERPLSVLTFEPHPAAVLGASAPPRLTRLTRKVELLGKFGVDLVVAQTFDARFAALTPEQFVSEVLVAGLRARVVAVGHDFQFGAQRAGNLDALRALARVHGFEVAVQPVVSDGEGPFSSSRVRRALAQGNLDEVRSVLGRLHAIEGDVATGEKRGRTLGFPTANLAQVEEALPAYGVYAVLADRARRSEAGGEFRGAPEGWGPERNLRGAPEGWGPERNLRGAPEGWGPERNLRGAPEGWGPERNLRGAPEGWGPERNLRGAPEGWGPERNLRGAPEGWGPERNLRGAPEGWGPERNLRGAPEGWGPERNFRALAAGVANVGLRPTVTGAGGHPSVEVHLFDLAHEDRDLYGDSLRIHFVARLREERRFPGLDALRMQIAEDAGQARRLLAGYTRNRDQPWG